MPKTIKPNSSARDVVIATLYAEARDQLKYEANGANGVEWVLWVIINRARLNQSYWGGNELKNICLKKDDNGVYQFECWKNEPNGIFVNEQTAYEECCDVFDKVIKNLKTYKWRSLDPTEGCDHYNNPYKEGYPAWTNNCDKHKLVGDYSTGSYHQFYKWKYQPEMNPYFYLGNEKISD